MPDPQAPVSKEVKALLVRIGHSAAIRGQLVWRSSRFRKVLVQPLCFPRMRLVQSGSGPPGRQP